MNPSYDVIIIGAGPSGSSCAYHTKRLAPNASVLLIDKANFPRYKPCGGGISPDILNYLDFSLQEVIDYRCKESELLFDKKTASYKHEDIFMVRREHFDDFLVKKAEEQGVEVKTSCQVLTIESPQSSPIVQTSQGPFRARIVVIAEGGSGKLVKKLGLPIQNKLFAALEYEHYQSAGDGKLKICMNQPLFGYAWSFPKSDGLSLGIGGILKGKTNIRLPELLKTFLKNQGIHEFNKKNLHGHPIQVYKGRQNLVYGATLLVGEISGCVDPLTAEGIRPAVKSAYFAAQTLVKTLHSNNLNSLKEYNHLFHKHIGKDFRWVHTLAYFINQHRKATLSLLGSQTAIKRFMSVFLGSSTYRSQLSLKNWIKLIQHVLRYKRKQKIMKQP